MSPTFLVIMGVSGSGKTTIAERVAAEIEGTFLEGDAFHPPENKAKMGAGIPLGDEDRWPWFDRLIAAAAEIREGGGTPVLACSALKKSYRDYLFAGFGRHHLVYLDGSFELIKSRMDARDHEYMKSDLLRSQFETLEVPADSDTVLTIPIERDPDAIVAEVVAWLRHDPA